MMSQSFIAAMVGLPLLVIVCVALAVWGRWFWMNDEHDGAFGMVGMIVAGLALVATLAGFGYGLYPYDMAYHSYRPVTGVATADVQSRFLAGDDGTTQNFLVTLPVGQYRCDDTRCASIKKGDAVSLSCIKEWVYGGTDGYDCRFVSVGASR
jgi:hypothetical protein